MPTDCDNLVIALAATWIVNHSPYTPIEAEQLLAAYRKAPEGKSISVHRVDEECVPSLAMVEWEYTQRVLSDCCGNVSQAAKLLGLHRRSLQRKLSKHAPRR